MQQQDHESTVRIGRVGRAGRASTPAAPYCHVPGRRRPGAPKPRYAPALKTASATPVASGSAAAARTSPHNARSCGVASGFTAPAARSSAAFQTDLKLAPAPMRGPQGTDPCTRTRPRDLRLAEAPAGSPHAELPPGAAPPGAPPRPLPLAPLAPGPPPATAPSLPVPRAHQRSKRLRCLPGLEPLSQPVTPPAPASRPVHRGAAVKSVLGRFDPGPAAGTPGRAPSLPPGACWRRPPGRPFSFLAMSGPLQAAPLRNSAAAPRLPPPDCCLRSVSGRAARIAGTSALGTPTPQSVRRSCLRTHTGSPKWSEAVDPAHLRLAFLGGCAPAPPPPRPACCACRRRSPHQW